MLPRPYKTPIYQDLAKPSRQRRKPTLKCTVFAFFSVLTFAFLTMLTVFTFSLYWSSPGHPADGRRRLKFNANETVWSLSHVHSNYGMRGTVLHKVVSPQQRRYNEHYGDRFAGKVLVKFKNGDRIFMNTSDITKCPKRFYPEGVTVRCHFRTRNPKSKGTMKSKRTETGIIMEWTDDDDANEVRIQFADANGEFDQLLPGDWIVGAAAAVEPKRMPKPAPTVPEYDSDLDYERPKKLPENAAAPFSTHTDCHAYKRSKKTKRTKRQNGCHN